METAELRTGWTPIADAVRFAGVPDKPYTDDRREGHVPEAPASFGSIVRTPLRAIRRRPTGSPLRGSDADRFHTLRTCYELTATVSIGCH